ncbi:adenylyl-sulfate kinase [Collimonas rhizosphaerae]|uniref:adenylyl-sulfate kinase n=1 Tax=Collimonas rhizosphaerae TaxID=3126357 RepID=UPI003CCC6265
MGSRFNNLTVVEREAPQRIFREEDLHPQLFAVTRTDRAKLNGHAAKVIWLTGLSGSGKSTIANALAMELHAMGRHSYILDGDNVRAGLNRDLGFSDACRAENMRRISEVAKLMMDAGLIVITAFISPFHKEREMARELIGDADFIEVYINTPLAVCEQRDPKGLYRKTRSGQLKNMTGIDSPYEAPEHPTAVIDCGATTVEAGVGLLLNLLDRSSK